MIWLVGNKGMLGKDIETMLNLSHVHYVASDQEIDITLFKDCYRFLKQQQNIKWIINCAAYTAVDAAEDDQETAYSINSAGALNLATVAYLCKTNLIHFSTDYVYSGNGSQPYKEDDFRDALTFYGKSKLLGDYYITALMPRYFIFRISWLYGLNGKNFVTTMLQKLQEGDVRVVNDQTGSPTHTKSLADFIVEHIILKDSTAYGVYNFSNTGEITWYAFAEEICSQAKNMGLIDQDRKVIPVDSKEYPAKAQRPKYSVLDKMKLMKTFKYIIPHWTTSLSDFMRDYNAQKTK